MNPPAHSVPDDARYGVVVCPRCRHAKGIDRTTKTTTCGRCSARHETADLRVFYTTGDTEALRVAVGIVEAKVTGGETGLIAAEEVEAEMQQRGIGRPRTPPSADADEATHIQFAASLAAGVEAMPKKVARIFAALDTAFPEGFTEDHVVSAFRAAGLPEPRAEQEIRRGLVTDELYEPRPGRLKRL